MQAFNWSLVLLLASEFQGFARELHDEAADFLAAAMARGDQEYFTIIRNNLKLDRKLDKANARPDTVAEDFERLGIPDLWREIANAVPSGSRWKIQLENLNRARNAIVHNQPGKLQILSREGYPINIRTFRSWRTACNGVSRQMDVISKRKIRGLTGFEPW